MGGPGRPHQQGSYDRRPYVGYLISILPLSGLGFIWIAFDSDQNQGWHAAP